MARPSRMWSLGSGSAAFLLLAVLGLPPLPALATPGGPTRYIVEVAPSANPRVTAERVGAAPDHVYRDAVRGYAARLSPRQLKKVRDDPATVSVQEDIVVGRIGPDLPVEQPPQFVTSGIRRIGGLRSPTARIDGVDERIAVDVAVIDDGVDDNHPDLNVAGTVNCVHPNKKGVAPGEHGTLVAGFVGAIDNDIGAVGTAPGARIWAIQAANSSGFLKLSSVLCALDWVAGHADVIDVVNMSYGFHYEPKTDACEPPGGQGQKKGQRQLDHEALCRLEAAGVTLVASAGNEASAKPQYPAAYAEVIAVSAIGDSDGKRDGSGSDVTCGGISPGEQRDDHFAFFSNYGKWVDIAAPGVCISSTYPGGRYATSSGTSFSAPLVAGAAALYLHDHPRATPADVRRILLRQAEPGPIPGDPDRFDEGVVDVSDL